MEHPREVIYLFSGSVEQYKPFYASALIQHDAMLHFCVEHGLSRYNFYGIDGVFDDPDDEGVVYWSSSRASTDMSRNFRASSYCRSNRSPMP